MRLFTHLSFRQHACPASRKNSALRVSFLFYTHEQSSDQCKYQVELEFQAKSLASLKIKKGMSLTPLN